MHYGEFAENIYLFFIFLMAIMKYENEKAKKKKGKTVKKRVAFEAIKKKIFQMCSLYIFL